jgi:hypothetical protein
LTAGAKFGLDCLPIVEIKRPSFECDVGERREELSGLPLPLFHTINAAEVEDSIAPNTAIFLRELSTDLLAPSSRAKSICET